MNSDIQSICSFQEITCDGLSQKSLVVFDIDETLITPTDGLLKPTGRSFQGWQKISLEQLEYYLSVILANINYALLDEAAPILLSTLHRNGIATIGLTVCSTGSVGVIPSLSLWRCDQLKKLGINFSSHWIEEYIFSELLEVPSAHPPLFKNGILFTGDLQHPEKSSKGLLLGAFFDRVMWEPEQIVFIDDNLMHLESVRQIADQRKIPFRGYCMNGPMHVLNEKIAEFQLQTLVDTGKWISEQEVKLNMV